MIRNNDPYWFEWLSYAQSQLLPNSVEQYKNIFTCCYKSNQIGYIISNGKTEFSLYGWNQSYTQNFTEMLLNQHV